MAESDGCDKDRKLPNYRKMIEIICPIIGNGIKCNSDSVRTLFEKTHHLQDML